MSERFRHAFVLSVVVALVLVSLVVTVGIPGVVHAKKTRLGLDLKGGTQLTYAVRTTAGKQPSASQLSDTISIMRSRSDTLGVSGVTITSYGGNEITVSLPDVQNTAQAAKVVGVTGQLFFYDWEESVIGPGGKVAGPNDESATCDSSNEAAGSASCALTEYEAVIRAAKQPTRHFPIESSPAPSYYYVDDKTDRVYAPNGPEPTEALLAADIAHARIKLPSAAHIVEVHPGTVLVQATSAPEVPVPNAFYVLRDDVKLTGKEISNPQVVTDPTQGIAVSFGFKGNGASVFGKVTAVLAKRGQNNSVDVSSSASTRSASTPRAARRSPAASPTRPRTSSRT
jgi:preprotein translocase subunit SecD